MNEQTPINKTEDKTEEETREFLKRFIDEDDLNCLEKGEDGNVLSCIKGIEETEESIKIETGQVYHGGELLKIMHVIAGESDKEVRTVINGQELIMKPKAEDTGEEK